MPQPGRARRNLAGLLAGFAALCSVGVGVPSRAQVPNDLPRRPAGWPRNLQLGMSDSPGGALRLSKASFRFRYQYLSGGVNTGRGWATWNENGRFVTRYVRESIRHRRIPIFSYYMARQSEPGGATEAEAVLGNLTNRATMLAYYDDLRLFFRRAGAFLGRMIVLHVEPDLWGFAQQASGDNDARSVPVEVASTGLPRLNGLPDNLSGFARALERLRDALAPNVHLAYHLSEWGTGVDIALSDPGTEEIAALSQKASDFYKSLNVDVDVVFTDVADRDAAFKKHVYGDGGASWWTAGDFARNRRFLGGFVRKARKRVVIWQIPIGNTRMRAVNNTWDHYQDNRAQWWLGRRSRDHLRAYARAGVIGLLFGRGATGATCACDAARDSVTNPRPINGNTIRSFNADDDGGYLRRRADLYYRNGVMRLP